MTGKSMPIQNDEHRIVVSHVTSRRPSSAGEGPLIKPVHEALEHGPHWDFTVFEMDLDGYVGQFNERIIGAYRGGRESSLPADSGVARSLVPPGTGVFRDFSYVAPELPRFIADQCVACMECVKACPDTAILGKVAEVETVDAAAEAIEEEAARSDFRTQWVVTTKFHGTFEKKGGKGGLFSIYVDPSKCKGCGECAEVCGKHAALVMEHKDDALVETFRRRSDWMKQLPQTPHRFLARGLAIDTMLDEERGLLYAGGAGSCAGCGEATAIRMMLAITGVAHGRDAIGIVAATGCNTVYGSTYPYNPYRVTWTNSLFENAPAVAMGIRHRWEQLGWSEKRLWVLGGDGAMYDIGLQSLSRMLASGMDIKVLVLDTQVYSNTGGQASTASFTGQAAKMSPHGRLVPGKIEKRKELANIALMHPDVYVAQTSTAYTAHFYQAIQDANSYPGPALVNVYTTCQPEHGVADDTAQRQGRRAVIGRAFPLFVHDPRRGSRLRERMRLQGNPGMTEDWAKNPEGEGQFTFVDFARTEGRFARHFAPDGTPSEDILTSEQERLANWRLLQELAGIGR
ncbi:MAG: thiamine pyrophosphate-dependent enzyme [bacterium]